VINEGDAGEAYSETQQAAVVAPVAATYDENEEGPREDTNRKASEVPPVTSTANIIANNSSAGGEDDVGATAAVQSGEEKPNDSRASTPSVQESTGVGVGRAGQTLEDVKETGEGAASRRTRTAKAAGVGAGGSEASILDVSVFVGSLQSSFDQVVPVPLPRLPLTRFWPAFSLFYKGDLTLQVCGAA
jgi:hypothetical protein